MSGPLPVGARDRGRGRNGAEPSGAQTSPAGDRAAADPQRPSGPEPSHAGTEPGSPGAADARRESPDSEEAGKDDPGRAAGQWDADEARSAWSTWQQIFIHGGVHAQNAGFGAQGSSAADGITSSGLSEFDTIQPDDGSVYTAPLLREALERLRRDHLLVLIGPPDTGKWFATRWLLGCVQAAPGKALGMSPALEVPKIRAKIIGEPAQYFIRGSRFWPTGRVIDDVGTAHEVAALARDLRAADSYMVISVHAEAALAEKVPFSLPWSAPGPCGLFDHLYALYSSDEIDSGMDGDQGWRFASSQPNEGDREEIAELLSEASERGSLAPIVVAEAAEMLANGADADKVRQHIGEQSGQTAAKEVAEWFNTEPKLELVTYLTVVAFLGGLDEATLEAEYDELCSRLSIGRHQPLDDNGKSPLPLPERHERLGINFVERSVPRSSLVPDSSIDLESDTHRRHVIRELWTRYGPDFWQAVDRWVAGLPARADNDGADFYGRASHIAHGLGHLAHDSFGQVWRTLEQWWVSAGEWPFAVATASSVAADDRLAPTILARCVSDVEAGNEGFFGTTRSWTSALVLGGPLGAEFPAESVPVLWRAVLDDSANGPTRLALWQLLADPANDATPAVVLGYMHSQILETPRRRRFVPLLNALRVLAGPLASDEFGADDASKAVAGLKLSKDPAPRKVLAAVLRPALLNRHEVVVEAVSLITTFVRRARAEGLQGQVAALMSDIETYSGPEHRERLHRQLVRILRWVFRREPAGEKDAALTQLFPELSPRFLSLPARSEKPTKEA